MKFVFGIAVGALGMWAYRGGKLDTLMGNAPESMDQVWQPAAERLSQAVNNNPVQDKVEQMRAPEIVTPSAAEIAGRPSEPLPTPGA